MTCSAWNMPEGLFFFFLLVFPPLPDPSLLLVVFEVRMEDRGVDGIGWSVNEIVELAPLAPSASAVSDEEESEDNVERRWRSRLRSWCGGDNWVKRAENCCCFLLPFLFSSVFFSTYEEAGS